MSSEDSGEGLDATLREFSSGQKLFGRYTLVKTLGRGGMGVVWLARDEELERNVALKFLPDLVVRDRAVLSDLKRETRRSLELTHKNIVRIHDFVYDENSGCISMEYIDGDTLSNFRVDKPGKVFEPAELREWTNQLCEALDYAHQHARIIHRDLKPSNLMVNGRGDLKVADFGIARSLNESVSALTMQRGRSGTLLYMSPQQLSGERGSALDDVYSVGASLYELITSKPPFYFGNIDRQILEKTPARMSDRRRELEIEEGPIDPTWEDVVRACLAKDPARRPQSAGKIAEQLAGPSPGKRRRQRADPERSKKRIRVFLAAVVLVGIIGVAGWLFRLLSKSAQSPSNQATPGPSLVVRETPARVVESLPSPASQSTKPATETATARPPSGPRVTANAIYEGTIHVKGDSSTNVPLVITIGSDLKSGTMNQSGRSGDIVVKFNGVWDALVLRAVTGEVVSKPQGISWEPESFILRFSDDAKTASYECVADGKTYLADLSLQSVPLTKAEAAYRGTIREQGDSGPGIPIAIRFAPNHTSGTMTQTSKFGDTVVRFNGIWDGDVLRAVTSEVVSKPKNIQWKSESFTLRITDDGEHAFYECNSEGRLYTAELTAGAVLR